ncbi:MAG: DUF29 domain-containing protein [Coleofasciculaceae cyanobacterium SM2_1_6]|nr:DUF29 domain-containing protein [Coleofasciculaceae cyanobacterium SM2_1_6]
MSVPNVPLEIAKAINLDRHPLASIGEDGSVNLDANLDVNLYATDFYAWTQAQVKLLQEQEWSQLDLLNLIEEVASLGKQQRQELRNRLSILIGHLLKWQYQPERRSRSWLATLQVQRLDTIELLEDNPSLKSDIAQTLPKGYLKAIALAVKSINLPPQIFLKNCPYSLTEILDKNFYPGEPSSLISELDD